jgi:hypothetical protein
MSTGAFQRVSASRSARVMQMTATRPPLDIGKTGRDALQLVHASILDDQSGAGSLRIVTGG